MKKLEVQSDFDQTNSKEQEKASCHVVETETCQPRYIACSVCDRAGKYDEVIACPSYGNMCHPPCTRFEGNPQLGEYAKWCCLRCINVDSVVETMKAANKANEIHPLMLAKETTFPQRKHDKLLEFLQEYLVIHGKHSYKFEHCDKVLQKSYKSTSAPQNKKTLEEMRNKSYSFGRDRVAWAFTIMMQHGLELPKPKRPEEVTLTEEPDYCLHHRILGHVIEDC